MDSNCNIIRSTKSAVLENGRTVRVHQRIDVGDWVKIKVEDESFMEKADGPAQIDSKQTKAQQAQKR